MDHLSFSNTPINRMPHLPHPGGDEGMMGNFSYGFHIWGITLPGGSTSPGTGDVMFVVICVTFLSFPIVVLCQSIQCMNMF